MITLSISFLFSGIVVGVFYLCWVPFMVAVVLSAFFKSLITPVVVLVISTFVYSNSAMNPVLYGYLSRDFRVAYKRLVSCVSAPCRRGHVLRKRSCELAGTSVRDATPSGHFHVECITERQ